MVRNLSLSDGGDSAFMQTRRLSRAVTEICDAKLQPFGISAVQFSLLEVINRLAPATRAAIARNQKLDKSTLTRDLKSILCQGWIKEVRHGANGRNRPVALTTAGKQLLLETESAWRAAQDEVKALLRHHGFIAE
jgi:DNA-binding MarR family transcriptional regulator